MNERTVVVSQLARSLSAWDELAPSKLDAWLAFLEHVAPTRALDRWAHRCQVDDLWLAFETLNGDAEAFQEFDQRLTKAVLGVSGRMRLTDDVRDDLLQGLREFLLLGDEPGLARYSGLGSLMGWLRVIATNRTLNTLKRDKPGESLGDVAFESLAVDRSDLEPFKEQYLSEFQSAFRDACAELTPRERNVLRYHLVERVQKSQIADLYQVTPVTVSRWFASIRLKLAQATLENLAERLGSTREELQGILDMLESRLDASFSEIWNEG